MANEFMTVRTEALDKVAVGAKELSTNFGDIAFDCFGLEGAEPKTQIINRFPLINWLLNTPLSKSMRSYAENGMMGMYKKDGEWIIEVPRTIWTELPQDTTGECCWHPFEFAKCSSTFPVKLLCLKDCDDILDVLVFENKRYDSKSAFKDVARAGETMAEVNKRVARWSMAFLTAYNVILGNSNASTDVLKPFHGLLQVMENPAVTNIYGGEILSAFDSLGCRLNVLGDGDYVFATNKLTYEAIKKQIVPDKYNRLPDDWARNGDEITYKGISFIRDPFLPVDFVNGTGEVWMLEGNVLGTYLATDLMPTEKFQRHSGLKQENDADCGSECDYYYNYGGVGNSNSNRLAIISDIPLSNICLSAIGDLAGLINPMTIMPEGPMEIEPPVPPIVVTPELKNLSLNDGAIALDPAFDTKTKNYTALTNDNVVRVMAEPVDKTLFMTLVVDGITHQFNEQMELADGVRNISVEVSNGETTENYYVALTVEQK